jgi:ATP-dependent Clp protease ATP-binding subunit ClpA
VHWLHLIINPLGRHFVTYIRRNTKQMDENFSPRVKDVISYSKEEALRLGHDYIGTEHLMLGLIREGEGIAIEILESLGVDLARLSQEN